MDLQTIIAVLLLIIGAGYLVARFVVKPFRKASAKHDCGPDCNCS